MSRHRINVSCSLGYFELPMWYGAGITADEVGTVSQLSNKHSTLRLPSKHDYIIYVGQMLGECWPSVKDDGPKLGQDLVFSLLMLGQGRPVGTIRKQLYDKEKTDCTYRTTLIKHWHSTKTDYFLGKFPVMGSEAVLGLLCSSLGAGLGKNSA